MDNKSPKFSELLPAYIKSMKIIERQRERVAKADAELSSSLIEMEPVRTALIDAMKSRGVQSIREYSYSGTYLYLNGDRLEEREIALPDDLDAEEAPTEPVEAAHV